MDSYTTINVANEEDDPDSVLSFYRSFLEFRKVHKQLLVYGKFKLLDRDNEGTMSFLKTSGDNFAFVVLSASHCLHLIQLISDAGEPRLYK